MRPKWTANFLDGRFARSRELEADSDGGERPSASVVSEPTDRDAHFGVRREIADEEIAVERIDTDVARRFLRLAACPAGVDGEDAKDERSIRRRRPKRGEGRRPHFPVGVDGARIDGDRHHLVDTRPLIHRDRWIRDRREDRYSARVRWLSGRLARTRKLGCRARSGHFALLRTDIAMRSRARRRRRRRSRLLELFGESRAKLLGLGVPRIAHQNFVERPSARS